MHRSLALAVSLVALATANLQPADGRVARSTDDPRIAAVGDIACKDPPKKNRQVCQYDDVSELIAEGDYDAFLALGDTQYEYGRYVDFVENYGVYFGRFLDITYPAVGNHEYGTPDAAGYFRYFGRAAHGPDGWYSYDLGDWHVIALNSAVCSPYYGAPCGPGHPQYEWLKADLAADDHVCTLAYWHHPVWDWEKYQNNHWVQSFDYDRGKPFWKLLVRNDADLVLAGHNHNYQRYAPMDEAGEEDPDHGIVEFIVGTGGRNTNDLGSVSTTPATFVTGTGSDFGILELALHPTSFNFAFIPTVSGGFRDAGSVACH